MSLFAKHNLWIDFIVLIIPFFLVFSGMRVPDLSRPQKPKPIRQAVLNKTPLETEIKSIFKIDIGPFITNPVFHVSSGSEEFLFESHFQHSPIQLLSLSPLPPRAPPPVTRFS